MSARSVGPSGMMREDNGSGSAPFCWRFTTDVFPWSQRSPGWLFATPVDQIRQKKKQTKKWWNPSHTNLNLSGETGNYKAGRSLPGACRRPPCAAEPCPLIQSADRWGGQIYTAGQRARSGGCPSRGWPGSASLPSARCGARQREKRKQTEQMVENKEARWPGDCVVPQTEGSSLTHQVAMPVQVSSCCNTSYEVIAIYLSLLSSRGPYMPTIWQKIHFGRMKMKVKWSQIT